jgi:O-acetyl-ADP-ribose deacetylase (regulator of RNase III)
MRYVKGNLLEAPVEALVNTVNTVGVMGKGIALQFKEAFPQNFKTYQAACKAGTLGVGQLLVVREPTLTGDKIIINFPTKTAWYQKSRYEYVEAGLAALVDVIAQHRIKSIAIPPLGCGNGGLDWPRVKAMMEQHLRPLEGVDVLVYEPNEAIKAELKRQSAEKPVKLTPAKAMTLHAMFHYEAAGEPASLFVANKLMYFLQRLGEGSVQNMAFKAHHYGPYTTQVEHFLHSMNGTYLRGLEQMNAKAFEPLELRYDKFEEIKQYVEKHLSVAQRAILTDLLRLTDGFQSALALELLATVDYVRRQHPGISGTDLVRAIHEWSDRKQHLFKPEYIRIAEDRLSQHALRLHFA